MFGSGDAFEKWLDGKIEVSKDKVKQEARFSVEKDLDMRHTVMRMVYEHGRDVLQVVLDVYKDFKKTGTIKEE